MPSPRLPAVLFDLDGTLIDSVQLIVQSARHAFATCEDYRGRVPDDDEWIVDLGMPLPTMFGRFTSDPEEVERLIDGYREFQLANHDDLVSCYEGVVKAVRTLHELGHPIAIVTSKSVPIAERGLALVELDGFVETIVGLESVRRHKPDPEPVRVALERLSLTPDQAIFVGDSPHDMTSGRKAGVITVAALWGPFTRAQLAEARPDYYIRGIRDLLPLVERVAEELEEGTQED
ncbi:MAG TPA: HAD-IA family hydrolase [Gemmatimonadaceae bacterium]|nr:HAD-IA family hydrolase [Gemmatimonadaceae bacterium]